MVEQKISSQESRSSTKADNSSPSFRDASYKRLSQNKILAYTIVVLVLSALALFSFTKIVNSTPCEDTFKKAQQNFKSNNYQKSYDVLSKYAAKCTKVDKKDSSGKKLKALEYGFLVTITAYRAEHYDVAKKYSAITTGVYEKLAVKDRGSVHDNIGLVLDLHDIKNGYYLHRRSL